MEHYKTIIYFTAKKNSYRVEYEYSNTLSRNVIVEKEKCYDKEFEIEELQAKIFENETCIKLFSPIPFTKTKNSTKSQAKELIKLALKNNKN